MAQSLLATYLFCFPRKVSATIWTTLCVIYKVITNNNNERHWATWITEADFELIIQTHHFSNVWLESDSSHSTDSHYIGTVIHDSILTTFVDWQLFSSFIQSNSSDKRFKKITSRRKVGTFLVTLPSTPLPSWDILEQANIDLLTTKYVVRQYHFRFYSIF